MVIGMQSVGKGEQNTQEGHAVFDPVFRYRSGLSKDLSLASVGSLECMERIRRRIDQAGVYYLGFATV